MNGSVVTLRIFACSPENLGPPGVQVVAWRVRGMVLGCRRMTTNSSPTKRSCQPPSASALGFREQPSEPLDESSVASLEIGDSLLEPRDLTAICALTGALLAGCRLRHHAVPRRPVSAQVHWVCCAKPALGTDVSALSSRHRCLLPRRHGAQGTGVFGARQVQRRISATAKVSPPPFQLTLVMTPLLQRDAAILRVGGGFAASPGRVRPPVLRRACS